MTNIYFKKDHISINLLIFIFSIFILFTGIILAIFSQIFHYSFLYIQLNFVFYSSVSLFLRNKFLIFFNIFFLIFFNFHTIYAYEKYLAVTQNQDWLNVLLFQYNVIAISLIVFFYNLKNEKISIKFEDTKLVKKIFIIFFTFFLIYLLINFFKTNLEINLNFSLVNIYYTLFDIDRLVFFIMGVYFFLNQKLKKKYFILIFFILIIYVLNGILYLGSRSSLLQIVMNIVIFMIISDDFYKIKISHLVKSAILIPFFILTFQIGSAVRKTNIPSYKLKDVDLWQELNTMIFRNSEPGATNYDIDWFRTLHDIVFGILDRFNYLMIYLNNFQIYEKLENSGSFNFKRYLYAIIDRLTPGFDIFETAPLKNLVYFAHTGIKSNISNSNQITPFIELNILFGFFSIIFIAIFFLTFNKIIVKSISSNKLMSLIILSNCFLILFSFFIGSGLDIVFIKILYFIIFNLVIYFLISINYEKIKNFTHNIKFF